jgi:hypothetical protein
LGVKLARFLPVEKLQWFVLECLSRRSPGISVSRAGESQTRLPAGRRASRRPGGGRLVRTHGRASGTTIDVRGGILQKMMLVFPFNFSEYDTWAYCGIGTYVVIENTSTMLIPGLEGLRAAQEKFPAELALRDLANVAGMDLANGTMRTSNETRSELVEVTAKLVKVQTEVKATINGTPMNSRTSRVIPATPDPKPQVRQVWTSKTADGGATVVKTPFASLKEDAPSSEGDEEVLVSGTAIKCRWIEQTATLEGDQFWRKSWMSVSIPGGLARCEITIGTPPKHSTSMRVTAFQKK